MLLSLLLSLSFGATSRLCSLPPFQWPADQNKAAVIGPSGSCVWAPQSGGAVNAVTDCGADNTGATYTDAAINACIVAMGAIGTPGRTLYFPRGTYKLANPIDVVRRVVLRGDGPYATLFVPDRRMSGIIVHYPCENGHNPACDLGRGDRSTIEQLGVQYSGTSSAWQASHAYALGDLVYSVANLNYAVVFEASTAGTSAGSEPAWSAKVDGDFVTDGGVTWHAIVVAGVRLNARADLENLYIASSPGNGIHIEASTPSKNANGWNVYYSRIELSKMNGIYAQGADANAGSGYSVDVGSNRLWGVYDISFLGNSYYAAQADSNGLGAYALVGGSNQGQLIGCYSEGGQPPSQLKGSSLAVGGLHGAGFSTDSGAFRMIATNRFETSGAGITFADTTAPSGAKASMPYSSDYVVSYTDTNEGSIGFTIQGGTSGSNAGWWRWRHANLDNRNFMSWAGVNADTGPGAIWFPLGAYLGDRMYLDGRSSKPTWTGTPENPGSFRFNTSLYTQTGFSPGVFGWSNFGAGSTPQVVTLRWPQIGLANEFDLTANPSGSPHIVDWKDESGVLFTNIGASAKQYVTLPNSSFNPNLAYVEFSAYVDNSNGIRLTSANHLFQYGALATVIGGYLESTTSGSFIKLKGASTSGTSGFRWNVVEISGTWTDGTSTFSPQFSGGALRFSAATGSNMLVAPTGEANGLSVRDAGGTSYHYWDTTAQTDNTSVVAGFASSVYLNGGDLHFNGAHLSNLLLVPDSDTDALDLKDAGGTYLMVANSVTKGFSLHGTNTSNSAGAGYIGEYVEGTGSGVASFSSGVTKNIASISLTAGDWDVTAITLVNNSAVTGTKWETSIVSSSAGSGTVGDTLAASPTMPTAAVGTTLTIPTKRFSLASTTTIYDTAAITFTVGTPTMEGRISARRVR